MAPLTEGKQYEHEKEKLCYICRKPFSANNNNMKYRKVKDHCPYAGKYRGAAHGICSLRYNIPREVAVVFHNGFTYYYHFIMKKLAEEFEEDFACLGENTENMLLFQCQSKRKP